MRLIDADDLMEQIRLAETSGEKHGREFASCFLAPSQEVSTEWWYVEELVDNAPSIEPEHSGWIPCSERMPREGVPVMVCNDDSQIMVARWEPEEWEWNYKYCAYDWDVWDNSEQGPIVAWMPLPEAYS